jgi:hypothetical protein
METSAATSLAQSMKLRPAKAFKRDFAILLRCRKQPADGSPFGFPPADHVRRNRAAPARKAGCWPPLIARLHGRRLIEAIFGLRAVDCMTTRSH